MTIFIVIPAHNEEAHIEKCLQSLTDQTRIPDKLILVNDRSTDRTREIMHDYAANHDWIHAHDFNSEGVHGPGSRVIEAFNHGFAQLDNSFDIICKFDADLIFPPGYLELMQSEYQNDHQLGMWGGHCSVEKNGNWELERATGKNHIRGALKSYRKGCFEDMGQLRSSIGWDTVDELLALYHGWQYKADQQILVKHLKPTAKSYSKLFGFNQGTIMYKIRLGLFTTVMRALRMAIRKNRLRYFFQAISGYLESKRMKTDYLVNESEGKFIRSKLSVFK